eukprot:361404-Amphidinium_carterae.2
MRAPSPPRSWWSGAWYDSMSGEVVAHDDIKKGVVVLECLPPHLRDLFAHGSRLKEEKMVLQSLRPLTESEATQIEKESLESLKSLDQILPS